ncbi:MULTISPECIES: MarR family winged helix-turn-helix transcriptional regulator [Actinoplanes]|uniref:Transcription factor n=2 Tax=Actinoplanes TaxID=1865 RepID=A0A0X3UNL6_9ACTN|nr:MULTISPECIES: MarR family transcriptional regulator [Actinoplanes]KUL34221.1 transcription factor [Actinoplanes awajinensis subsp. mycoplanecinus]GIE73897.1 MarR family transcriptional regulator [Actinoplanes palleronii]
MGADHELAPAQAETWESLLAVLLWLPATLETRLKRQGLSHAEFLILWCLTQHQDRPHTMSSLAELSRVTPSHLSRIAARLEKQGLLVREPDPADARYTIASLTAAGSRKYAEAAPGYYATLREHLFGRLTDEQARQLGGITGQIARSLDPRAS